MLLELCLHTPILHTVYHQLKDQICTLDLHVQLEVQVREFLAFAGRQSGEQALGHRRKIRLQLADAHKAFIVGIGCVVILACDEVVFHDERLAGSEVAGVVERNRLVGGNRGALSISSAVFPVAVWM